MSPTPPPTEDLDALFPPSFLRLLAHLPAWVRRMRAGHLEGRHAVRGEGGRFLFRGHRTYRPGDDLRRVDWRAEARSGRTLVRQYDVERDQRTLVWLDGSASMGPLGGHEASARAAALVAAFGLAAGGRVQVGVLREGEAEVLGEVAAWARLREVLHHLARHRPSGRADLETALARVMRSAPRQTRVVLISDLLTRADPGMLQPLAGRGIRGALLHLRVPEITAPEPRTAFLARDAESGASRRVRLDATTAARVTRRAQAHAARWARHIRSVGLVYRPFAPGTPPEDLLRHLVQEMP